MKRIILLNFIFFLSIHVWGQDPTYIRTGNTPLSNSDALKCANYLLSNPESVNIERRKILTSAMVNWMIDSPEYTFRIEDEDIKLMGEKMRLLPIYMAALTKAALENAPLKLREIELKERAENIFLDYCANAKYNVKTDKEIRKRLRLRKAVITTA